MLVEDIEPISEYYYMKIADFPEGRFLIVSPK